MADIIQVKKDYELAIETALGGSIQNIVTDNEQTAKRMIDFLKRTAMEGLHFCLFPISAEEEDSREKKYSGNRE